VVNLSKFQILNQSGISALGQSNQASQSILALLR
jgi:flagellin-like hook-associated protein FlgL